MDTTMRIFIPTANTYIWACEITAKLLAKYWPSHPPVDVVHFERRPAVDLPGFSLLDFGRQADCRRWIDQFIRYLRERNADELVLLMLDDYGLCQPVNESAIAAGVQALRDDPKLASFALTWQPTQKLPYRDRPDVVVFPKWDYSMNTQAGIWRRASLLDILVGAAAMCSPSWDFEQAASHWFHLHLYDQGFRMAGWNCPEPHNPSAFVDSVDKSGWPMAYNNLVRRRQRDTRHDAFLKAEGLLP